MESCKALVLLGTRPEAIKMAPLIHELRERESWAVKVVFTGQHRDMVESVLAAFGITSDIDLDVFEPGQPLASLSAGLLNQVPPVLRRERPDFLFVQGDTSSSFVAALCAFYEGIQVVHVEAGLRTDNPYSPFPEEMNRRLVSRIAAVHLAPTWEAKKSLADEGIDANVFVTGNTVIDALHAIVKLKSDIANPWLREGKRILLVTCHRRESWGPGLESVAAALADLARDHRDMSIIVPMHPNPIVRASLGVLSGLDNVDLIEPLGYSDFASLMQAAHVILTDSGGVQEEGPALGKPVLVIRENTERPEGVAAGTARLVGTQRENVYAQVNRLWMDDSAYGRMSRAINPYGDGEAARRSVDAVEFVAGHRSSAPDEFATSVDPGR